MLPELETNQLIPVISLFSGCGGMDLGFRQAGFYSVLAVDISSAAVQTYNHNHGAGVANEGDLSSMDGEQIIELLRERAHGIRPRGVIGGPPCQSFSLGN